MNGNFAKQSHILALIGRVKKVLKSVQLWLMIVVLQLHYNINIQVRSTTVRHNHNEARQHDNVTHMCNISVWATHDCLFHIPFLGAFNTITKAFWAPNNGTIFHVEHYGGIIRLKSACKLQWRVPVKISLQRCVKKFVSLEYNKIVVKHSTPNSLKWGGHLSSLPGRPKWHTSTRKPQYSTTGLKCTQQKT